MPKTVGCTNVQGSRSALSRFLIGAIIAILQTMNSLAKLIFGFVILTNFNWEEVAASTVTVTNAQQFQTAVANALEGDQILMAPGIYNTNVELPAAIIIEALDPSNRPILDGSNLQNSIIRVSYVNGMTTLRNLIFQNGVGSPAQSTTRGGSVYLASTQATIENSVFRYNNVGMGGGIYTSGSYLVVRDSVFHDNSATGYAGFSGAAVGSSMSILIFERSTFFNNVGSGLGYGGAIAVSSLSTEIRNCLAFNNNGSRGGFLHNAGSDLTIENSTIAFNSSPFNSAGAIYQTGTAASLKILNSILWGNTSPVDPDIRHLAGSMEIYHSIFSNDEEIPENNSSTISVGNMSVNPQFVDSQSSDFRLKASSPARNSGLNEYVTQDIDLSLQTRIQEAAVDRGPYEFEPPNCAADFNEDNQVTMNDLNMLLNAWGACTDCSMDLGGNGSIGLDDVVILMSEWGACL